MRLENKVAIVTGATSGMGRATAVLFAQEGAKVVVVGRNEERAKAVAKMLTEKYGIDADRISTAAGGATSDILPEADLNRVCVSVAK